MSKYYVIDRSEPDFWNIEEYDDILSALSFYEGQGSKVSITGNKMEVLSLLLYAKIHDISVRVGSDTHEYTI